MQASIDYYGTGNPIQDALLRFVLLLEGQQGRGYGDLKLDKALDEFIAHEGYLLTQEERTLLRDAETALMESISTTVTPMDKRKAS